MKLRTQIVVFALAGASTAALVGGVGLLTSRNLTQNLDLSVLFGEALQASQLADMMHDAVRGDAQLAMLGALNKDPSFVKEAEDALAEHREIFSQSIKKLSSLPLTPASRNLLDKVKPQVNSYVAAGAQLIQLAATNPQGVMGGLSAFQAAFKELEVGMEALSASIEKKR